MRKRNIALILAASMMATFAFGGTTAFAAEEGKTDSVTVGIMADPENMGPWSGMSMGRIAVLFTTYEYLLTREDGVAYGVLAKSCLLAYLTDFQVVTSFEGGIFDILYLFGKNHFFQCLLTFGHSVYHIREGVGGDKIGHIDVELSVRIRSGLAAVHLDFGIGNIEHLQAGKFIAEMSEVFRIQFSCQCKVGDAVGFLFGHHRDQCAGLADIIRFAYLCGCSQSTGNQ